MKLATIEINTPAGPCQRIAASVGDELFDLSAGYAAHLERVDPGCDAKRISSFVFPTNMVAFLSNGNLGMDAALHAIEASQIKEEAFGARTRYSPSEVRLVAPLPRPTAIRDFLTFEGHMKNASKALGRGGEVPQAFYEVPAYYKGDPDTVVGPDVSVEWPEYSEKFDFELELGMVVGRAGKNISKHDAGRFIAGYTIFNDFSARDQQMRESPVGMGPSKGKDFDGGNAIGPYLVTPDEIEIDNLQMKVRVNGEVWSEGTSRGMQHSFEDMIAHVSQNQTIYPGELWGSGTMTSGSGMEMDRWLQPGDTVELEVEGIGTLCNQVVRKST